MEDNLEKYSVKLFLLWIIIWAIIFFTSCSPKPIIGLNDHGKVIGKYSGNIVAVRFYLKGSKY